MSPCLLPLPDQHSVMFSGARSGECGLTWSQERLWRMMRDEPDGRRNNLHLHIPLPENLAPTVNRVLDILRMVLIRHDSLRTTYKVDNTGGHMQLIHGQGNLSVEVLPLSAVESDGTWDDLVGAMRQHPDFVMDELQVRVALFTRAGMVRHLVLVFSPIALDDWGRAIVEEEIYQLLEPDGVLEPDPWQPIQQRAWEQSVEGQRRSNAALVHLSKQLAEPMPPLFPAAYPKPSAAPGATHPFSEAYMDSAVVSAAGRTLAGRYRVSFYTVLMASVLASVSVRTGSAHLQFTTVVNNRFSHRSKGGVGPLTQTATVSVELERKNYAEIVKATLNALLTAYRNSRYDPHALDALESAQSGRNATTSDSPRLFINLTNSRNATVDLAPRETAQRLRELTARTTFKWREKPMQGHADLYIGARPSAASTSFHSRANTRVVPREEIRGTLFGVEAILLAAAEGRQMSSADLQAIVRG
ncbi:condensation domain-containing protein [Streptomyces solisilvae]|uniref:condensation domain-containing protein n=1 Tax=Streptomyces malaysiensis TaxID=92644 RepID=UPI00369609DF